MNTTTNTTISTKSSATKFAFTYNHVTKKIVGTDINFQKSGIPGSKEETELMARMEKHPTYTFEIIETEKKPAKQTYKGLTRDLMRAYIDIQKEEVKDNLTAQLDKMIEEKLAQATIKSWFLEEFKGFTVNKAKQEIQQHKLSSTKAKIRLIKATPKATIKEMPKVVNK